MVRCVGSWMNVNSVGLNLFQNITLRIQTADDDLARTATERSSGSRISRSSNAITLRKPNSTLTELKKRNRYHIGVGKSTRHCNDEDEDSITTRRGGGARRRKWRSPWNYPISGIPLPFLFLLRLNEFVFSFGSWDPTKPGSSTSLPFRKNNRVIKVCVCSLFVTCPIFESTSSSTRVCREFILTVHTRYTSVHMPTVANR